MLTRNRLLTRRRGRKHWVKVTIVRMRFAVSGLADLPLVDPTVLVWRRALLGFPAVPVLVTLTVRGYHGAHDRSGEGSWR